MTETRERPLITLVYVTQFDGWWSLPWQAWLQLCAHAITHAGAYTLPGLQLRRQPRTVIARRLEGSRRASYGTTRPDQLVVAPLDWTAEDFLSHLRHDCGVSEVQIAALVAEARGERDAGTPQAVVRVLRSLYLQLADEAGYDVCDEYEPGGVGVGMGPDGYAFCAQCEHARIVHEIAV